MALTRHFYRPDEVLSALSWCILNHRVCEAVFWALELIESDLGTEFLKELLETWAFSFGPAFMIWLYRLIEILQSESIGVNELIELVITLATERRRNHSLLVIIGSDQYIDWPEELNEMYQVLDSLTPYGKAIEYAFHVAPPEVRAQSFHRSDYRLPDEIRVKIAEWAQLLGRRRRREYKIPIDCLLFRTRRGYMTVYEDTLNELRVDLPKAFAGRGNFDRIFPDDIPDEWSKEDQEKSHSGGVLPNKMVRAEDIFKKYIERWYPGVSVKDVELLKLKYCIN